MGVQRRTFVLTLGVVVLIIAMGISAMSAWQRADSLMDRVLLAALSCTVVGAVHLLPSLCRSRAVWPLWMACFAVALYGHANFLSFASLRAAQSREATSPHAHALQDRQEAIEDALNSIKARPVTVIAGSLARDVSPERKQALTIELTEARRAAALRDELVTLAAQRADQASNEAVTDPVIKALGLVTGWSVQALTLVLSLTMAALLELIGMVLWRVVLTPEPVVTSPGDAVNPAPEPVGAFTHEPIAPAPVDDPLQRLRDAVANGTVKPTVAGIRQFMACSQARASEIRRGLER